MRIVSTSNINPVAITTLAAETCYASYGKHEGREGKYVGAIVKSGHTSVLEHYWIVVEIEDDVVEDLISEMLNLVSTPGVVYFRDVEFDYVLLNMRHLYELSDNVIVDRIIALMRQEETHEG